MTKKDLNQLRSFFEEGLDQLILDLDTPLEMLKPMLYSLKNGGKRLRPLLLLSILNAESPKLLKRGIQTAVALEFIHTYSLIHDDLPAMDNDDIRRGQPTSHVKFDEATAILAGDALLTDAFGLIASDEKLKNKQKVRLIHSLSLAAGSHGMVAGQLDDVKSEGKKIKLPELTQIHYFKTGKLFIFATTAASTIGEYDQIVSELLIRFGEEYGVAYQIHNDLLDAQGDQRDYSNNKSTYPILLGYEESVQILDDKIAEIQKIIDQIVSERGSEYRILEQFISYFK